MCKRCMEDAARREDMKNGYLDIVKGKDLTMACEEAAKASRMSAAKSLGILMEYMVGDKEANRRVHDWTNGFLVSLCVDDFDKAWASIREMVPGTPEQIADEACGKRPHALMGVYQSFRVLHLPHSDTMEILVHLNQLPDGDMHCVNDSKTMMREANKYKGGDPEFESLDELRETLTAKVKEVLGDNADVTVLTEAVGEKLFEKLGAKGANSFKELISKAMKKRYGDQKAPSCGEKSDGAPMPFDRGGPPPPSTN